jgi:anti-sigma factor RsiW
MANCRAVKGELTAWCDGELSRRRAERIEQHLAECAACSAEADSVSAAIRWQRQALLRVTAVADGEFGALQVKLRRALAAEPEPQGPFWSWLFRPVAIAAAAAMIGIALLFSIMGGPKAVLIPLGVESPPVAVSSEPELFEDYQLIQRLDALENFDTVESVPLSDTVESVPLSDDDQTLHAG